LFGKKSAPLLVGRFLSFSVALKLREVTFSLNSQGDIVAEQQQSFIESVVVKLRQFRVMRIEQQTSINHAPQLYRITAEKERGSTIISARLHDSD
jgi:hypothetical protein